MIFLFLVHHVWRHGSCALLIDCNGMHLLLIAHCPSKTSSAHILLFFICIQGAGLSPPGTAAAEAAGPSAAPPEKARHFNAANAIITDS